MAELPDELIDIHLTDQWRVHGGPRTKVAREELRDRLIPVIIKAFGSVESAFDVLLKESPCSNGYAIETLVRACELFFLRMTREAVEARDLPGETRFTGLQHQFAELDKYEREKCGASAPESERIQATLRTSFCHLPPPYYFSTSPNPDAETAIDLADHVPHFNYRYGPDFPDGDQAAIEAVRREANQKFAAKSVRSFEEHSSAREQWLSEVVYGAAPVFGRAAVKLDWSADCRRDVFKQFVIQAGQAGLVTLPPIRRFFAPPRARELDDALFPADPAQADLAPPSATEPGTNSTIELLDKILAQRPTTLEKWAAEHKFGRTTVFDWKAALVAGSTPKGKVSSEKCAEIEAAVEADAKALGLLTRTSSD